MPIKNISKLVAISCFVYIFSFTTATVSQGSGYNIYESALLVSWRNADEVARDQNRKPGKILEFYNIDEGMTVLDLSSGGGYYSKILSAVVGDNGKVFAHNAPYTRAERNAQLMPVYEALGNVEYIISPASDLPIEDNSVDRVLLFLMYHHMHYNEESGEQFPATSAATLAEIKRVLKPDGVLGVIEHLGMEGATRAETNAWHRVTNATAIADMESNGFELIKQSDILSRFEDPMNCFWSSCVERGKSNRLVHAYKPAE